MSVVPTVKYDIFISYADVDNVPCSKGDIGWVTNLVSMLQNLLNIKLGRLGTPSVWMSTESLNGSISGRILDNLENSAILLIILSSNFLASKGSQKELNHFVNKIEKSGQNIYEHLFIIEKDRLKNQLYPKVLMNLNSYRLWVNDRSGNSITLAYPKPNPNQLLYFSKVEDLASDVSMQLRTFRKKVDGGMKNELRTSKLSTVYLAEVTDDLREYRDGVQRYLRQAGMLVMPKVPSSTYPHRIAT